MKRAPTSTAAASRPHQSFRRARWLAYAVLTALVCGAALLSGTARAATVKVDGLTRYQTMQGFGSSERVFDDPHVFENFNPATGRALTTLTRSQQDEVLDRLYRELRLTRVRAASPDGGGVEPVNDNGDPTVLDLSKFNFSWKNLDAHCEYFSRARERGATDFFLSPLTRESWMGVSTPSDVAEYAEWLLAQVQRCAALGVRLPYLSVANEPSWNLNTMAAPFIRDVIKTLGPRLRAAGFDTRFVVADDVRLSTTAAVAEAVLSDPAARPYVGAIATHLYGGEPLSGAAQVKAVADRYGVPAWMTEFYEGALPQAGLPANAFSWALMMHALIADHGFSAIDYMWGYFGAWEGDGMLVRLNDSNGAYTGYTLRKVYYMTGQFSRFVSPGAVRVKVEPGGSPAKLSAYVKDGVVTVVAINESTSTQPVTFELQGLPPSASFLPVRTSDTEDWSPLAPIPVQGSGFSATLAPRSVTTFVSTPGATPLPPPGGGSPPPGEGSPPPGEGSPPPGEGLPPPGDRSPPPGGGESQPAIPVPSTGSPSGASGDTVPPTVSALRLSKKRFRTARRPPRRGGLPTGTTVSFRLSEAATARLRFEHLVRGVRVGRRCARLGRRPRRGRRCTRFVAVRGLIKLEGRAGANRLRFAGRLSKRRRLRPGRYRLTVDAVDAAGNRSSARRGRFILLPPR